MGRYHGEIPWGDTVGRYHGEIPWGDAMRSLRWAWRARLAWLQGWLQGWPQPELQPEWHGYRLYYIRPQAAVTYGYRPLLLRLPARLQAYTLRIAWRETRKEAAKTGMSVARYLREGRLTFATLALPAPYP